MPDTPRNNTGGGGLVKNLLFPSFVEAGANDAFASAPSNYDATNRSVVSDASTEVKHNLSFPLSTTRRRRTRTRLQQSASYTDERDSPTCQQQQHQSTPSFFASTKPPTAAAVRSNGLPAGGGKMLLEPASPPTVPRFTRTQSFTNSSLTTRQERRSLKTQSFSPTASPVSKQQLWTTVDENGSSRSTPSIARIPTTRITVETQDLEHAHASADTSRRELHMSTMAQAGGELDQEQAESETSQTSCSHEESEQTTRHDEAESSGPIPLPDPNTVAAEASYCRTAALDCIDLACSSGGDQHDDNIQWKEEATPAQTAFGKELMFRRDEYKRQAAEANGGDDEDSTASEMGTVVGMDRLEELEDMQDFYLGQGDEVQAAESSESDDLSLPMLDRKASTTQSRIFEDEKKSEKEANETMFSKAIKRIGSFRDTTSTAPNTPRMVQALTPSGHISEDAPASFLLRSPGSSVHVAAQHNMLAPRFWSMKQQQQQGTPRSSDDERDLRSLGSQMTKQFFLARGCLSFDTYDTTMDDNYEVSNNSRLPPMYRASASWDTGSRQERREAGQSIPFRPRSSHIRQRAGADRLKSALSTDYLPPRHANTMPSVHGARNYHRARAHSPDRLEIEREDALDILACLAERGISLQTNVNTDAQDSAIDVDVIEGDVVKLVDIDLTPKLDVMDVVDQLKKLCLKDVDGDALLSCPILRQRLAGLDELVKSHHYSTEMQRASASAASWLKSVGRTVGARKIELADISELPPSSQGQTTGESASEGVDLLTYKAMLHSAQLEIHEKDDIMDRLNEELANCKAEIGRLRSAATNVSVSFRSPNRSILDEDDISGADDAGDKVNVSFGNQSPILAPSQIDEDVHRLQDDSGDVATLQKALDLANDMIRQLFVELKSATGEQASADEAPVVTIDRDGRNAELNFPSDEEVATDWVALDPPLPPPASHSVRSPAVAGVLSQWTSDPQLHKSLLAWLDSALEDDDLSDLPPLMLSNLDHVVYDGFVLQVLPCLLRRPGIKVDVQTRTHQDARFDLSVTVVVPSTRNGSPHRGTPRSSSFGDSTTYSTSTALASNTNKSSKRFNFEDYGHSKKDYEMKRASSRLSYDEMADAPLATGEITPGIMSTLGGALGYLSSLRKGQAGTPGGNAPDTPTMRAMFESPARPSETGLQYNPSDDNDDAFVHPFHRVLSAPSGRLLITFVEYRGHAVVSDVAPESPLVGFIFPSDVLIAIDEKAVSGMRVRDIVKLLKERSDQQRALRVISSHDMTALTLHTSIVNDGAD